MEIKVIRKQKLIEAINIEHIVSIVIVTSYYGKSLAIALKRDGKFVGIHYIPLDKFTYSTPSDVAIPKENYKDIYILKKQVILANEDERNECSLSSSFLKATITKKITW